MCGGEPEMGRSAPDEALFGSDDPLSILLESVVRGVWLLLRSVVMLLVGAVRHPVAAALVLAGGAVSVLGGPRLLVAVAATGLVALLAWRLLRPKSFAAVAHPRLATPWRFLVYRARWPRVASREGLVTHDYSGRYWDSESGELPQVRRVVVTPGGVDRLLLRLPVGLTPEDVADRCPGIAHAFRCLEARVAPASPGQVWLELHRRDALEAVVAVPTPSSSVDLDAVPVGRHEDGTPWTLRLRGTHVLLAGATGAGKSSVLWAVLHATAPAIDDATLEVWALDPKGGMELRPGRALFARFEDGDPEAMCALLEDLVRVKDARSRDLAATGARLHQARPGSPHVLVIIDELATLTAFAERPVVRRIDQALGLLLTQGRACGITVLAAVQDPGKDVVSWRDLFPTRIAMRLDNPIQVDMVLGAGARDLGATADHISELTPGVAFVRVEGTREMKRVRAAYLSDDDIATLASSTRARPSVLAVREEPSPGGEAA